MELQAAIPFEDLVTFSEEKSGLASDIAASLLSRLPGDFQAMAAMGDFGVYDRLGLKVSREEACISSLYKQAASANGGECRVYYEGAPVIPGTYNNVTASSCQAFCNLNANCSSFSFCGNSCYLKQACIVDGEPLVNATTWTDGCVTYWKQCRQLEGYQVTERLVKEQGMEIENVITDSLGICADACNSNPDCKSFSFYAQSRGCHLKAKCVEPTDALIPPDDPANVYRTFYRCCTCTTTTSTTTSSPWQSLARALAFEGAGAEPGTYEGSYSVSDCQMFCNAHPDCNSFTLCGSSCYLKTLCVTTELALVSADGWNGCVTHFRPCEVTTTEVTTTEVTTTSTNTSVTTMETSTTPGITTIPSNQSEGSVTTTPSTEPTDDGGYLVNSARAMSVACVALVILSG
ncbi:unnamed protein product [Durusdinium trenchii]|uniref:Apple domain-containing protein n=1 Tax=Durusdinium trenchii TaxID=1381693 RepID=A0ABP0JNS2_9DINO